jgi:chaperone modulatory protein CbpM
MTRENSLVVISLQTEEISELTFEELCLAYGVSTDFIEEMIEYGIIEPIGEEPNNWRFTEIDLRRIRRILHLQQDLEINIAGAALVIDLMDELKTLRARIDTLEKYFQHPL